MTAQQVDLDARRFTLWDFAVILLAGMVAAAGARDYAGSWNDGSRLATVESLIDRHTLAIDDSIFVRPTAWIEPAQPTPYARSEPALLEHGTLDKMLVGGRFYSDKSPVPALALAGVYGSWQFATGQTAVQRPDRFVWILTLASSGLAYVAAVWCVFRFGLPLGMSLAGRLGLAASFALATVALPYSRHVNNHILLLAVAAGLTLGLASLNRGASALRLLGLGCLTGLGYAIDLGAGPPLLVCALAVVAWTCRGSLSLILFALGAMPWLVLHHAVNYAVGGTFKPANAVPDYFTWPGSPFGVQDLTGSWNHGGVGRFLLYAADLLVGKRGFLGHNLPLFLSVLGGAVLVARRVPEWPLLSFAACWSGGTWLAYSLTSTNLSGQCCSIRWFVPLLAPAYFVLTVLLQRQPRYWPAFLVLSACGLPIAGLAWIEGPWMKRMVPGYWFWFVGGMLAWLAVTCWTRRRESSVAAERLIPEPVAKRAA